VIKSIFSGFNNGMLKTGSVAALEAGLKLLKPLKPKLINPLASKARSAVKDTVREMNI
jgi:hypothetical protein